MVFSHLRIEVKPGKPHPYHSDNVQGKLCVTQATLGQGSTEERTVLQCSVGHKSPVYLCSLLPGKNECCSLNLEFKDDELVAFSVIGDRSVHLCGYFKSDEGDNLRDEYDTYPFFDSGEDIGETESDDSSEYDYDDEYDDDFIDDDDFELMQDSAVPNRGVVIEEIVDDETPTNGNEQSRRLKKKKQSGDQNGSDRQIIVKRDGGAALLESEDEDGFPISHVHKSKAKVQELEAEAVGQEDKVKSKKAKKNAGDSSDDATGKKRKVKITDQDGGQSERKTKKKKKQKEKDTDMSIDEKQDDEKVTELPKDEVEPEKVKEQETPNGSQENQKGIDTDVDGVPEENASDKKKKKKKKKKNQDVAEGSGKDANSTVGNKSKSPFESEEKQSAGKASQVRTFSNGLVIEELAMGKPDGKRASPGNQVSVHYIGKLKKNGKIFDSNVGRAPFKFRLGVGQVIKGWDVGVSGMRIGDKRRLTIPPSMGYGDKGAGGAIPPNAWLVFDVELVNVR
ncbi:hypothetical protein Tsubulata_024664 [Turnera subulata]|uniref:peptidylprolyl isomerase n=1 Tax=Turnera subulata TaxID=218843 RepID=A0A9Q0G6C1_9ROSI|nr:hypothetical protein Tsubulata_024664 [Turnera subulata]